MSPGSCEHVFHHVPDLDAYVCQKCAHVVTRADADKRRERRPNGTLEPMSFAVHRAAREMLGQTPLGPWRAV